MRTAQVTWSWLLDFTIQEELAQLNTNYVDLLLFHHRCRTEAETAHVWEAFEEAKRSGKAKLHAQP